MSANAGTGYNGGVEEHQHLPDVNRVSVLAAAVLLAYALTPFVRLTETQLVVPLPGFLFTFELGYATIVSFIVAVMAAAGTDWLLRTHPHIAGMRTQASWLLPALTAWSLGLPLSTLEPGPQWWAVFALGGLLFVLVLIAEYVALDPLDARYAPATAGLTAVSFALYLTLAVAVHAAGWRLYLLVPPLALAIGLVSLRTLYLRLGGRWNAAWALGITLLVSQIAVGLHYIPLTPLRFGLLLLGPAYALTSLAGAIEEGRPTGSVWVEPALMLALIVLLAVVVG